MKISNFFFAVVFAAIVVVLSLGITASTPTHQTDAYNNPPLRTCIGPWVSKDLSFYGYWHIQFLPSSLAPISTPNTIWNQQNQPIAIRWMLGKNGHCHCRNHLALSIHFICLRLEVFLHNCKYSLSYNSRVPQIGHLKPETILTIRQPGCCAHWKYSSGSPYFSKIWLLVPYSVSWV